MYHRHYFRLLTENPFKKTIRDEATGSAENANLCLCSRTHSCGTLLAVLAHPWVLWGSRAKWDVISQCKYIKWVLQKESQTDLVLKWGFDFMKILRKYKSVETTWKKHFCRSSWHPSFLISHCLLRAESVFGRRRMLWLLPSSHYASELKEPNTERDLSIAITLHLIFCGSRIMYPCWIINLS